MLGRMAWPAGLGAVVILLASGCSAPIRKVEVPVFFPSPPAPPRIQFLTAFSGSKDIETQSAFDRFIVGEKENLRVDKPYGVASFEGKIYVCDTNLTVEVFDLKKGTFGRLEGAVGPGTLRQPINISIDSDGNKYVADPVRAQIVQFDRNDGYVQAFGLDDPWRPVDVAPHGDRLYVADMEKGLVRVLDKSSGALIKSIGDRGDPSERLDRPTNLAFDSNGNLYVTDIGRFQVVRFDRDGHFKSTVGRPGDNLGHFARPKGIALDRENRLYVVDSSFNNIQIFNEAGRLLMFFGASGDRPGGMRLPAAVAVDYDNVDYFRQYAAPGFEIEYLLLVTSQFGERRVNVFGFGKQEGQHYPTDEEIEKEIEARRRKEAGN